MNKSVEQLELEFDCFFQKIGYKRVDTLVGKSPSFSNADYIRNKFFHKSVIELKIIDKDFFVEGGIIDRLQTIIMKPVNIDEKGIGQYQFIFPTENREGRNDTIEEPLRRILKKANRQIKETKQNLLSGKGFGIVIIALNMPTSINPEIIRQLASSILAREFSTINGFIVCTPSYFGYVPETGLSHPFCLPTIPSCAPKFLKKHCMKIAKEWCKFIDAGGHKRIG